MADPLKIKRRLDAVTTDYAVFERDQVLTHDQLNSVAEYLDDQSRLTRTQLVGIGILGGLWPTLGKERLVVGKGVGVTSDGDLLGFADDTAFDRWVKYDESAPIYEPFHDGEKRFPIIELLAADDRRIGSPLAELANSLPEMVAILFMESYENDPDLCTGGDCDNHGRSARNTRRLLLIERDVAAKLHVAGRLTTGAALAKSLHRVRAVRADLDTGADAKLDFNTAEGFAACYRKATRETLENLLKAVSQLDALLARRGDGSLPSTTEWPKRLRERLDASAVAISGVQYLHAHAKDLVAVWNELREALFADDGVLCPPTEAFPKHLLLGVLAAPANNRTGAFPAPWVAGGTVERQRVDYLMRKFAALLNAFELPKANWPKVTPSRRENLALGERAIPIYYRADAGLRELWNETRLARGETEDNAGYHWTPATPLKPLVNVAMPAGGGSDPFYHDVGGYDFFRIEGFLGLKADVAEEAIEILVRQRNLPIAVMSAVIHNQRIKVIRGPKFKKTSLHSIHYLFRQDLVSHIKDNIAYSTSLADTVKTAQRGWVEEENRKLKVGMTPVQHPALTKDFSVTLGASTAALQVGKKSLIGDTNDGPLMARTYKAFQTKQTTVAPTIGNLLLDSARAKIDIGDLARNDVISPIDAFAGSKTHHWVDWLGDILKKREDDQKDRLLLVNMLREHPGMEHAGGVVPGGTFVLVYDDSGIVIGDLMLPYWIDDNDESDLVEPELKVPDIDLRLPPSVPPIRFIKPLDLAFDDFKVTKVLPEIKVQQDYTRFFTDSLGSLSNVLKNSQVTNTIKETVKEATTDPALAQMLDIIKAQKAQIENLRAVENDPRAPQESLVAIKKQREQVEIQLADAVNTTTKYFAVEAPEDVRFSSDKSAVYDTIGGAVLALDAAPVGAKLRTDLQTTGTQAAKISGGSSAVVAGQLMGKMGISI